MFKVQLRYNSYHSTTNKDAVAMIVRRLRNSLIRSLFIMVLCIPLNSWGVLHKQFSYAAMWGHPMPGNIRSIFLRFAPPVIAPRMLAFFGEGSANYQAIFSTRPGYLKAMVSNSSQLPLTSGTLSGFVGPAMQEIATSSQHHKIAMSAKQGTIAFMATDSSNNQGIYLIGPRQLHTVVTQNTSIPHGPGQFKKLGSPQLVNGQCVVFWGKGMKQRTGLYLSDGQGHLTSLVTQGDQVGHANNKKRTVTRVGKFDLGYRPQGCGDHINYAVAIYDKQGDPVLYRVKGGQFYEALDSSDSIPGDYVGFFTNIKGLSYDKKTQRIAFVGQGIIGQSGIFIAHASGGKDITPLVTQDTPLPKSPGTFTHFSHPNLRGHNIVFHAQGSNGVSGVYLADLANNVFKVLSNKDSINGQAVQSVKITHQAFIGKRVAMLITFKSGRKGIFTAKLQSSAL